MEVVHTEIIFCQTLNSQTNSLNNNNNNNKYKMFITENNIKCSTNYNFRTAATLCNLETFLVSVI